MARSTTALRGSTWEMARAEALQRRVGKTGQNAIAEVVGEGGIGKTIILESLSDQAARGRIRSAVAVLAQSTTCPEVNGAVGSFGVVNK